MPIRQVRLRNWCQHRSLDVELRPGLNGILGSNGNGKSNFLDGVRFGITAQSINGGNNKDNLTWGQEHGSVEVEFEESGVQYQITRAIETSRCSLRYGDNRLVKASEIEQYLVSLYDAPLKMLLDNVFIGQGKIDQILSARPGERLKEFQASFALDRAQDAYRLLGVEANTCQVTPGLSELLQEACQAVNRARQDLKDLLAQQVSLEALIETLAPYEQQIAKALEAVKLQEAIRQADEQVGRAVSASSVATHQLATANEACARAREKVDGTRETAEAAQQQIRQIEFGIESYRRSREIRNRIELLQSEISAMQPPISDQELWQLQTDRTTVAAHFEHVSTMLTHPEMRPKLPAQLELTNELAQLIEHIGVHKQSYQVPSEVTVLDEQIKTLESDLASLGKGICYACGQPVHGGPEEVAKKEAELQRSQSARQQLLASYQATYEARTSELEARKIQVTEKLQSFEKTGTDLLMQRLAATTEKLKALDARLLKDEAARLDYTSKTQELTATKASLTGTVQDKPNENLLIDLKKIVTDFSIADAAYQEVKSSLQFLQRLSEQAQKALEEAHKFRKGLGETANLPTEEQLKQATLKVQQLVQARKESAELAIRRGVAEGLATQREQEARRLLEKSQQESDQAAWLDVINHVREALHVSKYPAQAMREYAGILNAHMEVYLDLLEAPFKMWLDDDMEFQVLFTSGPKKGYQLPGYRLSGGERILASTSFRLAMADTFARKMGLLVLDEPSAYLDGANIHHLQVLLLKLREISRTKGRQILIVTHEESLKGFLDHIVTI